MKLLVVLAQPPLPEGGAPGRCAVALLRGLRGHGLEVGALAARQVFDVPGEPPEDLPVRVVEVSPTDAPSRIRRLLRPRGELGGEFAEQVRQASRDADVVHLEETACAWADEHVGKPAVIHLHYLARRDRPFGPPWRKQFRRVLEFTLAEHAAMRRHRYLVASSPLVAGELRRMAPLARVVLAPLSLDPSYYSPAPLDGPPVAGVIGTAAWPPTASAVRRLLERVWPAVRRRVPEARLLIAGRGMRELVPDPGEGVDVLGEVESSAEFLERLSLLLYPLERGSGVKVKVLEAIASGLPVVTTAAGAEGIEADGGVVVDEDDERMAAAAATLLTDEGERHERGAFARGAFERRYTPGPATEPLVELYKLMAGLY